MAKPVVDRDRKTESSSTTPLTPPSTTSPVSVGLIVVVVVVVVVDAGVDAEAADAAVVGAADAIVDFDPAGATDPSDATSNVILLTASKIIL